MARACTSPPPGPTAILRSSYGRGATSNSWAIPWRPSTSHNSTLRPSPASAIAKAAATVVLPVPPLPVTMCRSVAMATLMTLPTGDEVGRPTAQRDDADHRYSQGHDSVGVPDSARAGAQHQADPRHLR